MWQAYGNLPFEISEHAGSLSPPLAPRRARSSPSIEDLGDAPIIEDLGGAPIIEEAASSDDEEDGRPAAPVPRTPFSPLAAPRGDARPRLLMLNRDGTGCGADPEDPWGASPRIVEEGIEEEEGIVV